MTGIERTSLLVLCISLMTGAMKIPISKTPAKSDDWVVREDGFGPVKIGMNLTQLNTVLHEKFTAPTDNDDQGCFYVKPEKFPHVSFMIEDGRFTRVDVDAAGIATASGVQVGDTEDQARK